MRSLPIDWGDDFQNLDEVATMKSLGGTSAVRLRFVDRHRIHWIAAAAFALTLLLGLLLAFRPLKTKIRFFAMVFGVAVIVPILPSPIDMRAATPFIREILDNGRVSRKETRVALVANRCRENTNVYHQLEEYLTRVRKAPFISVLRETQNYNRAAEQGLGIFELAPYLVNRDLELWQPVIDWLNSRRSQPVKRR
jgi:hypothetical protein